MPNVACHTINSHANAAAFVYFFQYGVCRIASYAFRPITRKQSGKAKYEIAAGRIRSTFVRT
jgi:hypothetical protein